MAVRIGIVGLGMMGTTHFASYGEIPGAEVVAVCDTDPRKLAGDWSAAAGNIATGAARRVDLSALARYAEVADLVADERVEVVDLCVPTYLHADMAVHALEAGRHVICEKPMALGSGDARRMIAAAARARRRLCVAHCLRFWPEYVALKALIDSGRYGPVRSAAFTRLGYMPRWAPDNWFADPARSGSAALDLHVHDADVVQWYFGRPREVLARGALTPGGGVNHVVAQYLYGDGPAVLATGSWDFPPTFPFRMMAEVVLESAAAVFSSLASPTLAVYEADRVTHPPVPKASAYTEELRYFVGCLAAGRAPERITAEEAAAAVALVEAEIESVRTGRPVAVP